MAKNKTDHMLNIAKFLSQILPQQQYLSQQQMDGYKAYFSLDEKFARREIFIPMGMRNKIIKQ